MVVRRFSFSSVVAPVKCTIFAFEIHTLPTPTLLEVNSSYRWHVWQKRFTYLTISTHVYQLLFGRLAETCKRATQFLPFYSAPWFIGVLMNLMTSR